VLFSISEPPHHEKFAGLNVDLEAGLHKRGPLRGSPL
jgi:hypothetical protein